MVFKMPASSEATSPRAPSFIPSFTRSRHRQAFPEHLPLPHTLLSPVDRKIHAGLQCERHACPARTSVSKVKPKATASPYSTAGNEPFTPEGAPHLQWVPQPGLGGAEAPHGPRTRLACYLEAPIVSGGLPSAVSLRGSRTSSFWGGPAFHGVAHSGLSGLATPCQVAMEPCSALPPHGT